MRVIFGNAAPGRESSMKRQAKAFSIFRISLFRSVNCWPSGTDLSPPSSVGRLSKCIWASGHSCMSFVPSEAPLSTAVSFDRLNFSGVVQAQRDQCLSGNSPGAEIGGKSKTFPLNFEKIASPGRRVNRGVGVGLNSVYGHITVKTPDLVRSPKISTVELS